MKIVVCVKRVPSTDSRIKIAADGTSLDTSSIEWILSPYDEFALETALRIKDAATDTEVVVLCLGPSDATKELRTCLALGADRAIHLEDDGASRHDAQVTSGLLAEAIAAEAPELVLCGKLAADSDQGQVGLLLSYRLGFPCVTEARELTAADGKVTAKRAAGGGTSEIWELPLPALVTITKGEHEPRYASLKGIMAAKKKPIDASDVSAPAETLRVTLMELPAERQAGRIVGEGAEAVGELVRLLREEAKVI